MTLKSRCKSLLKHPVNGSQLVHCFRASKCAALSDCQRLIVKCVSDVCSAPNCWVSRVLAAKIARQQNTDLVNPLRENLRLSVCVLNKA